MMRTILLALICTGFHSPWVQGQTAAERNRDGTAISFARSYELKSKTLDQTRRLNVYLPPSYGKSDRSYPTLYLLDGGMAEDFLHIVGIASLAADFRKIREFIVVGIEGIDRYHDFTFPSRQASDKQRLPTSGGSAKFREFLASELMPFVKKRFRVSGETALIGESIAGLFVAETILRQPELFTAYISVSPSLWWDDMSLAKEAGDLIRKNAREFSDRRAFLTIANEGGKMREGFDLLVDSIRKHAPDDFRLGGDPMPHETHGTILHPAAFEALRTIFAASPKAKGK